MSVSNALVLAAAVVLLVYGVLIYNGLVRLKHNVARAWSNIDVLLKQRHDELPKLVEVCRQYKLFEQDTLVRVTEARARVASAREAHDVPALGAAEDQLRTGLDRIFAVAEAYPELKANEHFMQLQGRITALENAIADRREWYNESVNVHNIRIEQFPDILVARLFGYVAQPLLRFAAAQTADVDVKALFRA
ncbi:LemA family protein [Pseudothauera rhizosphaerae]|uniref:LemA family protein n=1 Tax=Pseudothauera rhizosphaerae TaxID=2565932 RepID=A0A4S4APZ4_9RHOO|nr:LemA family protein [Pseudothauera rhizosphaerae]THF60503.1 LemA family protein [Pseudothauera rhizosphaerae]